MEEKRYLNRDLSWLEFNCRVLREAQDEGVPLLERVKFLAFLAHVLNGMKVFISAFLEVLK